MYLLLALYLDHLSLSISISIISREGRVQRCAISKPPERPNTSPIKNATLAGVRETVTRSQTLGSLQAAAARGELAGCATS